MKDFPIRSISAVFCGLWLAGLAAAQEPQPEAQHESAYFEAITVADGARFVVRLHNPDLVKQARDIVAGDQTERRHVSAAVVKAPASYNPGWRFHLDPNSVEFIGTGDQACDAATSTVEKNLDKVGGSFLPAGRWCPRSSRLIRELTPPREPVLSVVSAASLSEVAISPSSLASILGEELTDVTEAASGNELPTQLGGITVDFRKNGSDQRTKARLLLVSPERINFTVPPDVQAGTQTVRIIRVGARDLQTSARVEAIAPGVFFGRVDGKRYAAAYLLRVRGDGSRSEESLLSVDGDGTITAVPVDFGPEGDQLYLSLYGSGIGTGKVSVVVGPDEMPLLYSGPQGSLPGLDQINIALPRSLASKSTAEIKVVGENGNGQVLESVPVRLLIKAQ